MVQSKLPTFRTSKKISKGEEQALLPNPGPGVSIKGMQGSGGLRLYDL